MVGRKTLGISSLFATLFAIPSVHAHCPLCTIGVGALGGGALWLGISPTVIGLFIGGAAVALGIMIDRMMKHRIRFQEPLVIITTFILTVLPLVPILGSVTGLPIYLAGEYGSLLNRVYLIDTFLIGSLFGGLLVMASPWINTKVIALRKGKKFNYQRMTITVLTMVVFGTVLQLIGV